MRGERNKRLQKLRSELTERSFAHLYETGGMRRVYLQGRNNILKRLLVHAAAFNLSLILRKIWGGEAQAVTGTLFAACAPSGRAFARHGKIQGFRSQPQGALWHKVAKFATFHSAGSLLCTPA